jgi:hypothetical protein
MLRVSLALVERVRIVGPASASMLAVALSRVMSR